MPAEFVFMLEKLDDAPITAKHIAHWTSRDHLLSTVLPYIADSWPNSPTDELRPYWTKRMELMTQHHVGWESGCATPGRKKVLIDLHGGHPGVSRMKALSRSLVWWPGLDTDIEKMVKSCTPCQQN